MLAGQAKDLAGFTIHSAHEFSIDLEEPVSFFPALLAYEAASIVPEGSDPAARSWQEGCVGTGPYRVAVFEPGRRLELEPHRNYWRKGYPRNEGVLFSFGVPPKEILAGFRDGRFAVASDLVPADVESLLREPEFAAGYREAPRLVTYYAVFNRAHGPLADLRLRQRLIRAVDVPRLVRQTLGRVATPAQCFIAPGLLGHDPTVRSRMEPAPDTGEPAPSLELTAVANPVFFGGYADVARELAAAFADKGFRIRVVNKTMAEWFEASSRGTVDVVIGRWAADFPDSDNFAHVLHSKEGYLGRMVGSPEIDRLVARGRDETSAPLRHAIYRQIEETIVRDAVMIPLFHEQAYRFARPELEGLRVGFWGQTVAYEELRLRS
jgi:ABC-type oligopeptide transport system substrate-binding subunit